MFILHNCVFFISLLLICFGLTSDLEEELLVMSLICLLRHSVIKRLHLAGVRELVHETPCYLSHCLVWVVDKGFYFRDTFYRFYCEADWGEFSEDVAEMNVELDQFR